MTFLAEASARVADRYHRHRAHFHLEAEETIEKYGASQLVIDDDIIIVPLVDKIIFHDEPIFRNGLVLGDELASVSVMCWKIVVAVILVLATAFLVRSKVSLASAFTWLGEKTHKICIDRTYFLGFFKSPNVILECATTKDESDAIIALEAVTSLLDQPLQVMPSRDRQRIPSNENMDHIKRKCDVGEKDSASIRNTRCFVKDTSMDTLSGAIDAVNHFATFSSSTDRAETASNSKVPVVDRDYPHLVNETMLVSTTVEACDLTKVPVHSIKASTGEASLLHVKVANAVSLIEDSFIDTIIADATKDAARVAASMSIFAKLGLSPEIGAQLAMDRCSSELKQHHARERDDRHWYRTILLHQYSSQGAYHLADAMSSNIRGNSLWVMEVHTARDKCLTCVSNACFLGLIIAGIMFLCDVGYLTVEAFNWKNWTLQNLSRCMRCDGSDQLELTMPKESSWWSTFPGPPALVLLTTLLSRTTFCVVRRLLCIWLAGSILAVLTWVLQTFHVPILIRQVIGALLIWFNVGTSGVVIKTIYHRVIPQFALAILVSCYINRWCDTVIRKAKGSNDRETLVTEFTVRIDQARRWISCFPLFIGVLFYLLGLIWN